MGELRRSDSPNCLTKIPKILYWVKSRAARNADSSEPATKPGAGHTWETVRRYGFLAGVGHRRTLFLLRYSQAFSGAHLSGADDRDSLPSDPSTDTEAYPGQKFGSADLYNSCPRGGCCANLNPWNSRG